ncbi:polar amino acid transport system permease protein [Arthrobacter pascens]|uniref:amino acid ABC transporter permease n=1 Tax=Arthrobacter pascens TaxID=1677 RepID=UPI0027939FF4|nr:amino acid ABC transporter permease [Arthrobacter pascens]MDQ0676977.1 polar amino acid transport system permease protein [Arthrobacter pascens]
MDTFLTILQGVPMTIGLTVAALAIGAVGGIPLALGRRSNIPGIRFVAVSLIEVLRGIPPIVWLFIIYFGLGTALPMLDPLTSAIIGLGLISCAYMAEIYRGGLSAITRGQWEAGEALGMGRQSVLTFIIGPQVFRVSVPAAASYAIGLIKDSSVAYTIGVSEIVYFANDQSRQSSDALGPFFLAALVYVIMTIPCAWVTRALDARLRKRVAR